MFPSHNFQIIQISIQDCLTKFSMSNSVNFAGQRDRPIYQLKREMKMKVLSCIIIKPGEYVWDSLGSLSIWQTHCKAFSSIAVVIPYRAHHKPFSLRRIFVDFFVWAAISLAQSVKRINRLRINSSEFPITWTDRPEWPNPLPLDGRWLLPCTRHFKHYTGYKPQWKLTKKK